MLIAVFLRISTDAWNPSLPSVSLATRSIIKSQNQIQAVQLRYVPCLFAECIKGIDTVLGQHLESIFCDLFATLEC